MKRLGVALFTLAVGVGTVLPPSSAAPSFPRPARLVRRVLTTAKVVALTFDDGPSPQATPLLLEFLKKEKVHATFFVIGHEAVRFPALVQREVQEGHDVGNHGMTHRTLSGISEDAMRQEVSQGAETLTALGAPKPVLYRLPQGVGSQLGYRVLGQMGYTVVGWSVDPRDYQRRTSAAIIQDVLKQVAPGSIVIFHDGPGKRLATIEAVKTIIPRLKAEGYRIIPVSELLKVPVRG